MEQKRVHVYTSPKSITVDDKTIDVEFEIPDVYPSDFFYLLWWERDGVFAYFTADADGNNQVRHDLEPTDENYEAYVVPFVEAWEAHHLDYKKSVALQALSRKFSARVSTATIESSLGFVVDADILSLTNVQQLLFVMENTDKETVEFCDAENNLHTLTLADVQTLEKEIAPVAVELRAWKFGLRERIRGAVTVEEVEAIESEIAKA